jgi:hypothetical protein
MDESIRIWLNRRYARLAARINVSRAGNLTAIYFWLLVVCRLVFCVYRATRQSITHDEAFTYLTFVKVPIFIAVDAFDANNHILHTLLCKLSVSAFGDSAATLRIPSIVSGVLLSIAVVRFSNLIRIASVRIAFVTLILIHPLLMDFCILARGYSLSLALLVFGMICVTREFFVLGGLAFGLASGANLTALFPALALLIAAAIVKKNVQPVLRASVLMVLMSSLIYAPFLPQLRQSSFYVGSSSLSEAARNLVLLTIRTNFETAGLFGYASAATWIAQCLVPAVIIQVALRRRRRMEYWQGLLTWAFFISILELICANKLLGVLYPIDRTGLWLTILFILYWAALVDGLESSGLRILNVGICLLVSVQAATQLQSQSFIVWAADHDTKMCAEYLREHTQEFPPDSVEVMVSVARYPSMEFYRNAMALRSIKPIQRLPRVTFNRAKYYLLTYPDIFSEEVRGLVIIKADRERGSLFAMSPD